MIYDLKPHMKGWPCVQGFGSRVIAHDLYENAELKALGLQYMSKEELLREADIISLHCPLLPSTYHIIDRARCWRPALLLVDRGNTFTLAGV